ncbi:MAG: PilZ domain-containing protein [Desulfobacterales bacterium]|nr:PilZ domain-containing protein [Desulfobacterales bacterium]
MAKNNPNEPLNDKRTEPRQIAEPFQSVEIKLPHSGQMYHFKLRDISFGGLCVVIREDSAILKQLTVGQILKINVYRTEQTAASDHFKSQVRHITKTDKARYHGHYLVGLQILDHPG